LSHTSHVYINMVLVGFLLEQVFGQISHLYFLDVNYVYKSKVHRNYKNWRVHTFALSDVLFL
jgi:hypothetical protein